MDAHNFACSPSSLLILIGSCLQALNEIAKDLPDGSQPSKGTKPTKRKKAGVEEEMMVIDLTEEAETNPAATLRPSEKVAPSQQLPGRRHAGKNRQPSRLAKESRPDSKQPLPSPPQASKVSVGPVSDCGY